MMKLTIRQLAQKVGQLSNRAICNRFTRMTKRNSNFFATSKKPFSTHLNLEEESGNFESDILNEDGSPSDLHEFIRNAETMRMLKERGINKLFPIQTETFKWIYNGEDVVAKDRTGSGKTIAYSLPLIERLREAGMFERVGNQKNKSILGVVIVPTRELCVQVSKEFEKQSHHNSNVPEFNVLTIYGGVDIQRQISQLNYGVDFIVATPGRLIDLINRGVIDFPNTETVILDEVDEMLDMGFKDDIDTILKKIRETKVNPDLQYLLFSATMPKWVIETATRLLKPKYHKIDLIRGSEAKTSTTIDHYAIECNYRDRLTILPTIISKYSEEDSKCIVFTETKREANEIFEKCFKGEASLLHGDVSQKQREISFEHFKTGNYKTLVATNIAARGLDINDVDLIVQINLPDQASYIHRSGRTARAGKRGKCVVFFNSSELQEIRRIETTANILFSKEKPPQFDSDEMIKGLESKLSSVKTSQSVIYEKAAEVLINRMGAKEALAKALYMNNSAGFTGEDPNDSKRSFKNYSRDKFGGDKSYGNRDRSYNSTSDYKPSYRNNSSRGDNWNSNSSNNRGGGGNSWGNKGNSKYQNIDSNNDYDNGWN